MHAGGGGVLVGRSQRRATERGTAVAEGQVLASALPLAVSETSGDSLSFSLPQLCEMRVMTELTQGLNDVTVPKSLLRSERSVNIS